MKDQKDSVDQPSRREETVAPGILRRTYFDESGREVRMVYQARWRIGGKGRYDTENFDQFAEAKKYRAAVHANGWHRPVEIPEPTSASEAKPRSAQYVPTVQEYIPTFLRSRSGVSGSHLADLKRHLSSHLKPKFGRYLLSEVRHTDAGNLIRTLEELVICAECNEKSPECPGCGGSLAINEERAFQCQSKTCNAVVSKCSGCGTDNVLRAEFAPKTIANIHSSIVSFFAAAMADGVIGSNPFQNIRLQRTDGSLERMNFLTPEELGLIIDAIEPGLERRGTDGRTRKLSAQAATRAKALVKTLAGTGIRYGEAIALASEAATLSDDRVRLHVGWAAKREGKNRSIYRREPLPKSVRSRRAVSAPTEVADVIRELVAELEPGALIFGNTHGELWRNNNFHDTVWQPALAVAMANGLTKKPTVHDLRHTHASWLLSAGRPITSVSRRLGHSSIQVTVDRYGHLQPEVDEEDLNVLGDMLSRATGKPGVFA